jgi:hypothetical protein
MTEPSGPDESTLSGSSYKVPGLVYDYIGSGGYIYGGDSLHASAKVYTFSLNRRATPLF